MSTPPSPQIASMDGCERTSMMLRLHPQFNAPDADVAILSSDNTIFRVYQKNVDIIMGGLPVDGGDSTYVSEVGDIEVAVYKLPERRNVLENVLQFLYRRKHVFPATLSFELLMDIAEAAEKYEVFAAVMMCGIHIRKHIPSKPKEILSYALKYNHTELVDEAALHCVVLPLSESIRAVPFTVEQVQKWILYREEWLKVFQEQRKSSKATCQRHYYSAANGMSGYRDYLFQLEGVQSLSQLRKQLATRLPMCIDRSCGDVANLDKVNEAMATRIDSFPAFTTFGERSLKGQIKGKSLQ